jgi:hypothetical protein
VLGRLVELRQPQPDGVSAETGDAGEVGDTAATMLSSQEADEQPAGLLVQGGDQPIDVAVSPGDVARRLLPAGQAHAAVWFTM